EHCAHLADFDAAMVFDLRTMICRKLRNFRFVKNPKLTESFDHCRPETSVRAVLHLERDACAACESFTRKNANGINSLAADLAHQLAASGAKQFSIESSFGSTYHLGTIDHRRHDAARSLRYYRVSVRRTHQPREGNRKRAKRHAKGRRAAAVD